jgi:hypothetical protein
MITAKIITNKHYYKFKGSKLFQLFQFIIKVALENNLKVDPKLKHVFVFGIKHTFRISGTTITILFKSITKSLHYRQQYQFPQC